MAPSTGGKREHRQRASGSLIAPSTEGKRKQQTTGQPLVDGALYWRREGTAERPLSVGKHKEYCNNNNKTNSNNNKVAIIGSNGQPVHGPHI